MNLGFPEMIFIFLVALLIFGPRKLPELGRQVGKAMAEFKRASNEFKSQFENEVRQLEVEEALKREREELKNAVTTPAEAVAHARAWAGLDETPAAPANPAEPPDSGIDQGKTDTGKGADGAV